MSSNGSAVGQLLQPGSLCVGWRPDLEGAVYHLAHCFLLLGFMGGSGVYGCFYLFGFLGTGYLCCVLWGWFGACGLDVVLWSVLLAVACVLQLAHLLYRLHEDALPEEFELLYKTLCLPLQVPLPAYREVVRCCEGKVLTLATEETYAVEGETPINRLSLLLSGRVRVSQDGQFLHYIFPYQFMDSPEWESLHPSEEGVFQLLELLSRATLKLCPGDRPPWLQPRLLNCKDQRTILSPGHVILPGRSLVCTPSFSPTGRLAGEVRADRDDSGTAATPRALSDFESCAFTSLPSWRRHPKSQKHRFFPLLTAGSWASYIASLSIICKVGITKPTSQGCEDSMSQFR
ncbi:popeye domain-containing protein 2 isoform X3 [Camelus ferus]|uniref:Popeye domain-containing protein 2 isoform X3 n=2 Tax=Camelus TaxID=9836 RepID=A0A8B8T152_CAMFR|nr:popeye domain-containing protein 2 isoform X3 [Camelus ferus]XP_045363175.1 popeye domain-containing protein 2 isoform X3 [Camelus bactrianus]